MVLRFESYDAGAGNSGVNSGRIAAGGAGPSPLSTADFCGGAEFPGRSALISVAGTVERARPGADGGRARANADAENEAVADLDSAAAALRSWVVGWTHRFDPLGGRRSVEPNPAGVRRLVEAVIDVLLERRPAEQVKRLVSREVFGLLTAVAQRRAATRFAARSMVRSIQLHTPGPDAVESTVLVQDGPRVRAVALRFERIRIQGFERISGGEAQGWPVGNTPSPNTQSWSTQNTNSQASNANALSPNAQGSSAQSPNIQGGNAQSAVAQGGITHSPGAQGGNTQGANTQGANTQGAGTQGRLEWRCTALQFA